ncbi:S1-like domain-containing RNA-binding protein [uncultured Eudoraea sp.]|jgi:predicted RNA-binding protein (virulence factor B family)|uniref:CvfB family protein n=1 Tax=uncultured Eudoraea sp. TaxID=1035614 RepID=UPI0026255275|nr:S1-like domain-containing RNA-binding protein [uncultured Eudoraea sp.]
MIELGNYNTLKILRETDVGLFLGDDDVDDLLLPSKYVPDEFNIGDDISVFCYLDHEERPIATTLKPLIKRNTFGWLKVAEVNEFGAFMDWGLEKHLLVPFREQQTKMIEGESYVVFCYLDEKSFRLVASSRLNKFAKNEEISLNPNDEVDLLVSRQSELGWDVIINNKYQGLVFKSEVFQPMQVGATLKGYVKKIREDNKVDVVLKPIGYLGLEPAAKKIFEQLELAGGYISLHDKSAPEEIQEMFQMSKKTFKKAIGTLYRNRKIEIKNDGIYSV